MTDDKLYTSLSANTIMAILTNHVQRTRLITSSTEKHFSLDSEDDFRSGCRNVSHQQQFFSELHSPGRSLYTNYCYWLLTRKNGELNVTSLTRLACHFAQLKCVRSLPHFIIRWDTRLLFLSCDSNKGKHLNKACLLTHCSEDGVSFDTLPIV